MNSIDGRAAATPQPGLEYPIVYTVVTWVRILTVVGALVFGPGWTYMSIRPPYAHGQVVFNPILMGIDALMIAGLVYGLAWAFTARITLYADRFEQSKPLIRRALGLNDITGRRYTTGRGAGYPMIVPKTGVAFSIDTTSYGLDERFNRWFMQLPDVEKIERDKNTERIRGDAALGATPAERIAADAARKQNLIAAGGLLAAASFALFLISITSREYFAGFFIANALLPWMAFFLMAFYRDQVAGPDGGKLMFLPLAVIVPVLSLGGLATENARLIDPTAVIAWGLAVGVILLLAGRSFLAAQSKTGPNLRGSIVLMLIFLPFAWVYAGGTIALANRTMDGAPPEIVPTKVIGKYVQRGKSSTHYYVRVAGSARLEDGTSIRVGGNQYSQTNKGDVVCVAVHPGRLGFPWMEPMNCSSEQGSSG